MTRAAPAELLAAVAGPQLVPFVAVEAMYPDGPVRLCSLPRGATVLADGQTYYGTGALGSITDLSESTDNPSDGFAIELAGIPGNFGAYLRGQDVQGQPVTVRFGVCTPAGQALASTVVMVGIMDTQDVQAGEETWVRVVCEGPGVDWERARVSRVTHVDQTQRHPGDRIFKYVAAMENFTIAWGRG